MNSRPWISCFPSECTQKYKCPENWQKDKYPENWQENKYPKVGKRPESCEMQPKCQRFYSKEGEKAIHLQAAHGIGISFRMSLERQMPRKLTEKQ